MNTLFIFDSYLNTGKLNFDSCVKDGDIFVFPLSSKSSARKQVSKLIKTSGKDAKFLESARLINASAAALRERYISFIADLPERAGRGNKNLRERFAFSCQASLWWLSLVALKDVHESDGFNRLAQLDSIVNAVKKEKIGKIILSSMSKKLERAIRMYAVENNIEFETIPLKKRITVEIRGIGTRARKSERLLFFKHILFLFFYFLRFYGIELMIKAKMGKREIPKNPKLLFLTSYFNIDETLAKKGIFNDSIYAGLQSALERKGENIVWCARRYMPNDNQKESDKKSLAYAQKFIKNKYSFFFLEEFSSLWLQLKALFVILHSSLKFLTIRKDVEKAYNFAFGDYNSYPLFEDDWYNSFAGKAGYKGVLNYYIFRNMLKVFNAQKCLYPCEMREWEKALIYAREDLNIPTKLYGYQPGTISRMLLRYFNDPKEIIEKNEYVIPKPDKIICNGKISYDYFRESGWPDEKLSMAEAIRYGHLKEEMFLRRKEERKNTVLVTFSISEKEGSSIFNAAYEAFKDKKDMRIWLRPHPALRFEKILELSGIYDNPFEIKKGSLKEALKEARVVIAGESSVSVEAIACGCDVILINTPEWINMSPLKYIESPMIRDVYSDEELRDAVDDIFARETTPPDGEAKNIIDRFFYLNEKTDTPEAFLRVLTEKNN